MKNERTDVPESFQEYLEIIYRLSLKNPGGWVKNKEISDRLKVKAPSVTNMMEKLTNANFIEWAPRSGIRLTEGGREAAKKIVLNHIVVELFLERILGIDDVVQLNSIACDFEHHITDYISRKIKELLDIDEILKNVDNFILEDRPPSHLETKFIYTDRTIQKNLSIMQQDLNRRFPQESDQKFIAEQIQKFTIQIQKDAKERIARK